MTVIGAHTPTRVTVSTMEGWLVGRVRTPDYTACAACLYRHPVLGVVQMPWDEAVKRGHPGDTTG